MTEQSKHINVTAARARRLSYPAPGQAVIEGVKISSCGPTDVRVKTLYSGVSRGTEGLVYKGKVPATEWQRMRCPFMAGEFSFPISYGYACVAKVIGTGDDVSSLSTGDLVFVLHPHQTEMTIPEDVCNKVPDEVKAERAILTANAETALNAVWDAEIGAGESPACAIIGAGAVGLLTAFVLRKVTGIDATIIDIEPGKQRAVEAMGFQFLAPGGSKPENTQVFDRIFHTSASASGLQTAIDMAAFEATIVELSWYGSNEIKVGLGGAFHANRLTIRSSQVGSIAKPFRGKIGYRDRLAQAMAMLDDPRLDVLLEESIEFDTLPDHVDAIFSSDRFCQVISYT